MRQLSRRACLVGGSSRNRAMHGAALPIRRLGLGRAFPPCFIACYVGEAPRAMVLCGNEPGGAWVVHDSR